jgi:hypothetical protein
MRNVWEFGLKVILFYPRKFPRMQAVYKQIPFRKETFARCMGNVTYLRPKYTDKKLNKIFLRKFNRDRVQKS